MFKILMFFRSSFKNIKLLTKDTRKLTYFCNLADLAAFTFYTFSIKNY